ERLRIARDLHDRVGQSLAYLAFELDRIANQVAGQPVEAQINRLRTDTRQVVTEVRETLYDLRTDVSEGTSLIATLQGFLDRVARRSGAAVELDHDASGRLPVPQEREMWRIAQEAVTNAERHAKARRITVRWRCDGQSGRLEVADDGAGLPASAAADDSYGIRGMRERADAIGAALEIRSVSGGGTTLTCTLGGHPR
ncbi:MAG: sensor histidine kinase, partial [Acidimicrobiales bacterium]